MKIRLLTIAFILHLFLWSNIYSQTAKNSKPNIVLIMGDDLTFNDIEPYGSTQVRTPNLTALAKESMCFDNMFTASSIIV
jgi:predicted AlkP superfamily pyrophosphatase or phosphodiesterase